jgi:hypothetical protein
MFDIMGIAEDFVNRGLKLKAFNVYDQKQHIVRMTFDELPADSHMS